MPAPLLALYLPQHLLANAASLAWFAVRGRGRVIARANWHALRGLPAMLRERRRVQKARRASLRELSRAMSHGWRAPYRARWRRHAPATAAPPPAGPPPVTSAGAAVSRERHDVLCLPIIDWDYRFQRPQQLLSQFADAGHRVFYASITFREDGPPYQLI